MPRKNQKQKKTEEIESKIQEDGADDDWSDASEEEVVIKKKNKKTDK